MGCVYQSYSFIFRGKHPKDSINNNNRPIKTQYQMIKWDTNSVLYHLFPPCNRVTFNRYFYNWSFWQHFYQLIINLSRLCNQLLLLNWNIFSKIINNRNKYMCALLGVLHRRALCQQACWARWTSHKSLPKTVFFVFVIILSPVFLNTWVLFNPLPSMLGIFKNFVW